MKFKDCIFGSIESKRYEIKKRTYLFYKEIADIYFKNLFEIKIQKFTKQDFENFKIEVFRKNLSSSTIKIIEIILNNSLEYAFKIGVLKEKKKVSLKIKQTQKRIVELSKTEQEKLENYIISNKKVYNYGILLSLYLGLRIGELLALKWSDVDLKNRTIEINSTTCQIVVSHKFIKFSDEPKTLNSKRIIPISSKVFSLMCELKKFQKNNSEYVVSRENGKQILIRVYQQSFENLLKKLKIKHHGFHSLRHTFATRAIEKGVDIKTLSELLGHSSVKVTLSRYVHSSMKQKTLAINKIFS